MDPILALLDKNARLSNAEIATALGITEAEVSKTIAGYEAAGIIRGYKPLVDWEQSGRNYISAQIMVKIMLNGKTGFDDIAAQLCSFPEVETITLMSGAYDVALTVSGKTFKEVATFVASRLSPLEGVQSTSTSFCLKTYKERGVISEKPKDDREVAL